MALTKDNPRRFETSSFSAAIASTAIYQGACVGSVRASGHAAGGAFDSATHRFAGFAAARAAIGERVTVDTRGRVILTVAGTSAASVNAVVYASDDNSFNISGSGIPIGRISWVQDDGKCVVDFDAGFEASAPGLTTSASGGVAIQGSNGFPAIIIRRRTEQSGVVSDGVALYDVTASNAVNSVIQSASGAFTQDDVGKCCAVHSRSSTVALASARYGFIVSVQSTTQCTTTLNLAPGALTNAMFVYGTDNATPMQAAITAAIASRDKTLYLQPGIICSSAALTAAGNIIMEGAGRSYTEKEWYDFDYAGTALVVCGYGANGAFYAGNNTTGPRLYGFNVDAMGISGLALYLNGRAGHVSDLTILKPAGGSGNSHAFKTGPGSMVDHCTIIGGYNCHPFAAGGDSQITHCNIYGTGTGYYAIKASGIGDTIIAHNHMWAPGSGLFNAGSVFVEAWQTDQDLASVQITNNQFDTAKNAPHINLAVAAGCTLRGVNISDNNSFNNNSVTTPYPWLKLAVNATGAIRGLKVDGNTVVGSWATATAGVHSYLIDGTGIAGTVKGAHVANNFIDRPTGGGYNAFTPGYSAGNIRVDGAGVETIF